MYHVQVCFPCCVYIWSTVMQLHVWALLPDKKSSRWLLKHTIYSTDYTMEQVADSLKSFAIFNVLVFLIFLNSFYLSQLSCRWRHGRSAVNLGKDLQQDSQTLELKAWFSAVDKSGKFKVWIYQHGILPKLLWPLLIYEVQGTIVEGFEWNISQLLRRWLGLPKSLSSIALYGRRQAAAYFHLPNRGI